MIGKKVYYTGDRANLDGVGFITGYNEQARTVDVDLGNGRLFRGVSLHAFAGPGRRFVWWDDYEAERIRKIGAFHASVCKDPECTMCHPV